MKNISDPRLLGRHTVRRLTSGVPCDRSHTAPRALIALLTLVLAAAVSYTCVSAASGILDLGSPTNDVSPNLPLDFFHRVGQPAMSGSRAQVLFIGTQADGFSAMERWPMVKALEQFGTLSGVKALTTPCLVVNTSGPCLTAYPTYDWSRAHYVSRYVDFVHKDVANLPGRPFQRLSQREAALLRRYGPRPYKPGVVENFGACNAATPRSYPVVLIGGYLETISNIVGCFDYSTSVPTAGGNSQQVPLSFEQTRSRIAGNVKSPGESTGPDVNAEANLISALICHADHLQPKKVCSRPGIKGILKFVKK